jgi:uncharacterized protein YbbK (DUF523 family)
LRSALLGNKVRYNGGHAHDRFITGTLGEYVDFVPVCPEVECGLGIPRLTTKEIRRLIDAEIIAVGFISLKWLISWRNLIRTVL